MIFVVIRHSILLLFLFVFIYSNTKKPYSLEDLKKIALKQNFSENRRQNNWQINQNNLKVQRNTLYLPILFLNSSSPLGLNANNANGNLLNYDFIPQNDNSSQAVFNADLGINGGTPFGLNYAINLQETLHYRNQDNFLTNEIRLNLVLKQSLFKYNASKYNFLESRTNLHIEKKRIKQAQKDLIHSVNLAYYNFVLNDYQLSLSEKRLEVSTSNLITAQNKYKSGVQTEIEYLRIRQNKRREEISLERRKIQKLRILNNIQNLLNLKSSSNEIHIANTLPFSRINFDVQRSIAYNTNHNILLHEAYLDKWQLDKNHRQDKLNNQFQSDLSFAFNQNLTDNTDYQIGFGINIVAPLYKSQNRKYIKKNYQINVNTYRQQISELQRSIEQDIQFRVNNIQNSLLLIKLSEENLQIASNNYYIDQKRFNLGIINSDVFLRTEDSYFLAKLNLIEEKINYLRSISEIKQEYDMWEIKN